MKFKVRFTHTIEGFVELEAENEDSALSEANDILSLLHVHMDPDNIPEGDFNIETHESEIEFGEVIEL